MLAESVSISNRSRLEGCDLQIWSKFFEHGPDLPSITGTFEDPIVVRSAGEELQAGCTGCPADSHVVRWCVVCSIALWSKTECHTDQLQVSRHRPYERCDECGSVYKMEYVGPPDDPHHPHHGHEEPKTMADFVKSDYWYR